MHAINHIGAMLMKDFPSKVHGSDVDQVVEQFERWGVVHVEKVLPSHEAALMETRDLIEMTDFFVANYKEIDSEDWNLKNQALKRFGDIKPNIPAYLLHHVPLLTGMFVQLLGLDQPLRKILGRLGGGSDVSLLTSSNVRPTNLPHSERRTEWLWHQDHRFYIKNGITVWMPLTACGSDALSIEFIVGDANPPHKQKIQMPTDPNTNWSIDPAYVEKLLLTNSRYAPIFSFGDAVFFNGYIPHKTYFTPDMSKPRASVDLRLEFLDKPSV